MKYKALALLTIVILAGTIVGQIERTVFIFDGAGGLSARFENPDLPGDTIRPWEAWAAAIDTINAHRAYYNMRDTITWTVDYDFPTAINSDIFILTLGWEGTGAEVLSPAQQELLIALLDSTDRTPEKQTALFIEGNDFAELYCDTSTGLYAGTFADYTGTILLDGNAGSVSTLVGEDSSLAEGMSFAYRVTTGGPCTDMDDIVVNDTLWDSHHLKYLFNASTRNPARGLQRRSYSPGAVVTLPFQYGNIPRGGGTLNSKEELLVRMFDFAIMPLVSIESDLPSETLWVDTVYTLEYQAYDNRCVKNLIYEYSSDGGSSWIVLNEIATPELDTVSSLDFSIPPSTGDDCYLRLIVTDSTYNYTADTSESFVVMNFGIDEGSTMPDSPHLRSYPNPFNAQLTFDVIVDKATEIEIYDLTGRIVAELPVSPARSTVRWTPENHPTGLYLARINGTGESVKAVYLR